jgi:hypothetical protein
MLRTLILTATIFASTAAFADSVDQGQQTGPSIKQRLDCGSPGRPCPLVRPLQRRTPIGPWASPRGIDPTNAVHECTRAAGDNNFTISVTKLPDGFQIGCKIERGPEKPE